MKRSAEECEAEAHKFCVDWGWVSVEGVVSTEEVTETFYVQFVLPHFLDESNIAAAQRALVKQFGAAKPDEQDSVARSGTEDELFSLLEEYYDTYYDDSKVTVHVYDKDERADDERKGKQKVARGARQDFNKQIKKHSDETAIRVSSVLNSTRQHENMEREKANAIDKHHTVIRFDPNSSSRVSLAWATASGKKKINGLAYPNRISQGKLWRGYMRDCDNARKTDPLSVEYDFLVWSNTERLVLDVEGARPEDETMLFGVIMRVEAAIQRMMTNAFARGRISAAVTRDIDVDQCSDEKHWYTLVRGADGAPLPKGKHSLFLTGIWLVEDLPKEDAELVFTNRCSPFIPLVIGIGKESLVAEFAAWHVNELVGKIINTPIRILPSGKTLRYNGRQDRSADNKMKQLDSCTQMGGSTCRCSSCAMPDTEFGSEVGNPLFTQMSHLDRAKNYLKVMYSLHCTVVTRKETSGPIALRALTLTQLNAIRTTMTNEHGSYAFPRSLVGDPTAHFELTSALGILMGASVHRIKPP